MALSPSTIIKIRKVVSITIWWIVINILFGLYNNSIIRSNFVKEVSEIYDLKLSLMANILSAFLAGVLGATVLVFVIYEKFRKRPYLHGVIAASGTFIIVFYIITPIISVIYYTFQTGLSIFDPTVAIAVVEQVTSRTVTTYLIVWAILISTTWLVIQVSEKFGPGVLWKLIRGDYQFPRQEDRVFMFIDLKSSTTLAEKLGNEKYFGLLKEFFSDCTDPVLNTKGEIYQYVGDEVVITWPLKAGVENNNCLNCYTMLRQIIEEKESYYNDTFGAKPEFRAGLHYGKVITGEIGIIKKDIAFSGDVLNTTSRITEACKKFGNDVIVSEDLSEKLDLKPEWKLDMLGNLTLRGKSLPLNLFAINFN